MQDYEEMAPKDYTKGNEELDRREDPCKPQLGCATTYQLLDEIHTRLVVGRPSDGISTLIEYVKGQLTNSELNYRTIDHA